MEDEDGLSHLDGSGRARMVDIGGKQGSARRAVARASLRMLPATLAALQQGTTPKGDVLAVARVAAIQAAKRTPELIPLCHHVALTGCEVHFTPDTDGERLHVEMTVRAQDRTGVEMEALTGASIAALTVYDMLKAIDRGMVIESVALHEKTGGVRGDYTRT
jgi:cyclic pyranopterin phosphate synthase